MLSINVTYNDKTQVYTFSGYYGVNFRRYVAYMYLKQKVKYIFRGLSMTGFNTYSFYLLEVYIIFKHVLNTSIERGINKHAIQQTVDYIENNTWLHTNTDLIENKLDMDTIGKEMVYKPLKFQMPVFDNYFKLKDKLKLKGGYLDVSVGGGKALSNDTLVKVESGWKKIGDITINDKVMSVDESYVTVTGVYPQGLKDMLHIRFEDGRYKRVDYEHLWEVYNNITGEINVMETQEIMYHPELKNGNLYITLLQPDFNKKEDKELPIPPEELGWYLTSKNSLKEYSKEICDKLEEIRILHTNNGNRYIPDMYMEASASSRLLLLKSILKSIHTSFNKFGHILVRLTNLRLSKDIQLLVRSLGYKCEYNIIGKTKDIVVLTIDTDIQKELKTTVNYIKNKYIPYLKIMDVFKLSKKEEATCISVDHPRRLFVVEDYIVTHNTFLSLSLSKGVNSDKVLIIAPKVTVNDVWVNSIENELFKHKTTLYTSLSKNRYNGEKYIVMHYEALDKLLDFFNEIDSEHLTIIVDEFHNFNDIKSNRTKKILEVFQQSQCSNIILMSGTPIKANVKELLPVLKILDTKFTPIVEKNFMKLYKTTNWLLRDTLQARYSDYTITIKKDDLELPEVVYETLLIKIKNGKNFTLEKIKDEMAKYYTERKKELEENFEDYEVTYYKLYNQVKNSIPEDAVSEQEWLKYEEDFKSVCKAYRERKLVFCPDLLKSVNEFEKNIILPALTGEDKKRFKEAKTIVKYLTLKVIGEVLSNVVLKSRIDCQTEIADNIDYESIMNSTLKKTIVMTNYIDVAEKVVKKLGSKYNISKVYGEHVKYGKDEINMFKNNKDYNPMVATYKSLSTGVHLTVANIEILIGYPYRQYIYEQAVARVHRTGQDTTCVIYNIQLDTGEEKNIMDRDIDIIQFYKEKVEEITGKDIPLDVETREGQTLAISNESNDREFLNFLQEETNYRNTFSFTDISKKEKKLDIVYEW